MGKLGHSSSTFKRAAKYQLKVEDEHGINLCWKFVLELLGRFGLSVGMLTVLEVLSTEIFLV